MMEYLSFMIHILFISVLIYCDNPTSIVKPYNGSDPGYILAESTSGLANRLRVLAAYMYVAQFKYEQAHLVFVWDKNHACPGHYLSIFEPINNVIFATNSSRYVLDKHAKVVYENSYAVFNWIMQMNQIPKSKYGYPTWNQIHYLMYSKYYPTREVMLKASNFIERYNICNSSAMHLRTTDLDKIMPSRKKTNLQHYFKFVESRPSEEKVFLLTDDPKTQRMLIHKYGKHKIIVYRDIKEAHEQPSLFVTNSKDKINHNKHVSSSHSLLPTIIQVNNNNNNNILVNLTEDHRYTSLEHTLIDVIIAAHAKEFKSSGFSSLSDLVLTFEAIGKRDRGWCS